MNKLFKGLTGITLGLALCFGFSFSCSNKQSSSQMARAEGSQTITLVANNANTGNTSTTYVTTAYSFEYEKVDWTMNQWNPKNLQIKTNQSSASSEFYFFTGEFPGVITSVEISFSALTLKSTNNPGMFIVAKDSAYTSLASSGGTEMAWDADSKTLSWTANASSGYKAISFYQNGKVATGTNYMSSIAVTYEDSGSGGDATKLDTPSPVFDRANKQITWADIDNASSYTVVVDNGEPITNATSPFSVSSYESGINHTAKVTAVGDGTNYSDSSSGSVSFAFLGHAGTEADPYTVNDARAAIDMNDGVSDVYATGKVSAIVTAFNSQYGNISYNISSDGLTTSPQLQAYRGKSYNGDSFTSANDIQVGDTVVVKGDLTKYNSTYEFAADNQLVSLVRPQGATLDHLEIAGDPDKLNYKTTDNAWDPTGLEVTAYYDDDTHTDVTSLVKWSYDPATPAVMGEGHGDVTFIATYDNVSTSTEIEVDVIVATTVDTYHLSGKKLIYEVHEGVSYYMNIDNATPSVKPLAVTSKGSASPLVFTLVGDDTYTITNEAGTKGLYATTSNTVCWGDNGLTYHWVINDTKVGELEGTYNLIGQTADTKKSNGISERYLCVYNNSDWRTYGSADADNRKAMIQIEEAKDIFGFSVDATNANKNVLKGSTFDAAAAEDAGFEPRMYYTDNTYDVIPCSAVTWTLETSVVTSEAVLFASYSTYDTVEIIGMNIYAPTMVSLSLNTTNVKTSYLIGDSLDISGITIKGVDADDNQYDLEISQCTFSPANGDALTADNTSVTVTYVNENSSVATGSYSISVVAFTGFTKVTSVDDLEVGASYVIGVDTANPTYRLMGSINDASAAKSFRNAVDASSVMSTDATRVLDTANSVAGASTFTLLKNDNGQYAFYDLGNSKYLSGFVHDGDNHLNDSETLSDTAWWGISFSSGVMSATLKGTNRVLGYNYNGGSDPRFATYGGYSSNISHIALFKMDGSSVKTSVEDFANDWLKMNDSNYDGDIETPSCAENYGLLKLAYADLNEAEKNILQYCDDFADARARLNAWATANGETFTYGAAEPFAALKGRGIFGIDKLSEDEDNNVAIILFMVATLGVGALSAFYLVKKRKRA